MPETLSREELKWLVKALNEYNQSTDEGDERRIAVLKRDTDEDIEDKLVDRIQQELEEDKDSAWIGDLPEELVLFAGDHDLLAGEEDNEDEDTEEEEDESEDEDEEEVDDEEDESEDDDDDEADEDVSEDADEDVVEEEAEEDDDEDEEDEDDDEDDEDEAEDEEVEEKSTCNVGSHVLLITIFSKADGKEKKTTGQVFFDGKLTSVSCSTNDLIQTLSLFEKEDVGTKEDSDESEDEQGDGDSLLDGVESLDDFKVLLRQANKLKQRDQRVAFLIENEIATEDELEDKSGKQLGYMLTKWGREHLGD